MHVNVNGCTHVLVCSGMHVLFLSHTHCGFMHPDTILLCLFLLPYHTGDVLPYVTTDVTSHTVTVTRPTITKLVYFYLGCVCLCVIFCVIGLCWGFLIF